MPNFRADTPNQGREAGFDANTMLIASPDASHARSWTTAAPKRGE
jgi:hypothetical protein